MTLATLRFVGVVCSVVTSRLLFIHDERGVFVVSFLFAAFTSGCGAVETREQEGTRETRLQSRVNSNTINSNVGI